MEYFCPQCGENENLHFNYDWSKQHRPIINVICNECGEFFGEDDQYTKKKVRKIEDIEDEFEIGGSE